MILADYIALLGMGFSVCMFIALALQKSSQPITLEGFLLANHSANSGQFGSSLAAASTSLATVLIFFISTSAYFGLFLLWCGLTYLLGQALFINFMKRINISTKDLTTNADFVLRFTRAKRTAQVIAFLTVSAFLLILFLELYIGSEIIGYYLVDLGRIGKTIAFGGLGLIVILYVRLGGLRVVFRTDVWQYMLMILASVSLLLFSIFVPSISDTTAMYSKGPFFASGGRVEIFLFLAWILILNLSLPFTQLSSWQRLAATESVDTALRGLKEKAPGFLTIWMMPVIALVILNSKGLLPHSLTSLFDILREQSGDVTTLLFPLIFVGFASALFSTADTAIIALQLSISDNVTLGKKLKTFNEKKLGRAIMLITGAIVVSLAVVFSVAEAQIGDWFIPLVYAIFSQLTIIAPQIINSMLEASGKIENKNFTRTSDFVNMLGLCIAWIVLVGATIGRAVGTLPQLGTQEGATYLAVLISGSGLLLARRLAKPPVSFSS